jgi:hypothetical protein
LKPNILFLLIDSLRQECTTLDCELFNINSNVHTFIDDLNDSGYYASVIIPESINNTNVVKSFSDNKEEKTKDIFKKLGYI